jgi:hypothetical protein
VAPTQTLMSFTPINKGPVTRWVVNDAVRNRSRGLDSDKLYDLPDEPLSGLPAPKKRKQTSKAPARLKKTSSPILAHPWPKVTKMESSQLGTPLDSKKMPLRRSSTQTELSSSAGINKPILGPVKITTTKDALKAKSVSLGQTTMEKLASFRFRPTSQRLPDIEAYGIAEPMGGVVEELEWAHGLPHGVTSHKEENPYHVCDDHDSTSHIKGDIYPVLDEHDPTSHDEWDVYNGFDDPDPISCNEQDPYHVFDEATVLDHDDDVIMLGDEESSMSQRGATAIVQPDSEDEFPLDDDLETEMAQLLMPDKSYKSLSPRLGLQSLQNGDLQSGGINCVSFQPDSSSSHTLVGGNNTAPDARSGSDASLDSVHYLGTVLRPLGEAIDRPSVHEEEHGRASTEAFYPPATIASPDNFAQTLPLVESDEYSPLKPFARPGFPSKVLDRSSITGISSNIILRTCFRIGEALREGALCGGLGQDAIIELFARVVDSSQDITPTKLYFEFADLFHDRPPFIRGTLENNKISSLQETESRMLLGVNGPAPMVRCLGRLKRVTAGPPGWMLYIINIRPSDWEEVRWTRKIAGAGMMK